MLCRSQAPRMGRPRSYIYTRSPQHGQQHDRGSSRKQVLLRTAPHPFGSMQSLCDNVYWKDGVVIDAAFIHGLTAVRPRSNRARLPVGIEASVVTIGPASHEAVGGSHDQDDNWFVNSDPFGGEVVRLP